MVRRSTPPESHARAPQGAFSAPRWTARTLSENFPAGAVCRVALSAAGSASVGSRTRMLLMASRRHCQGPWWFRFMSSRRD